MALALLASLAVVMPLGPTESAHPPARRAATGRLWRGVADAIARQAKRSRKDSGARTGLQAAKALYPLIKVGMTETDVLDLLRGPDHLNRNYGRFWGYSIGKGQEIEIEFDSGLGKVVRKHEVGLGLDPPPAPPPPIPPNLRPYIKDYSAAGTTLRAGFIPYKPELVWGEPLEVTLKAENLGPGDFNFMFGSDNHLKVEVTDAAGKLLPDPYANSRDMDGVMGFEILTPGGLVFTRTLDLLQFRTIDKPGVYAVACSVPLDGPNMDKKGPAKPVVIKSAFRLTILGRTPQRVAKVLDELVAKAQAAR